MTDTPIDLVVTAIPILSDNYVWLLERGGEAMVVDPGEAAPVAAVLRERGLRLAAVLITHHHPDHVGGVAALCEAAGSPATPVYGPRAEAARIPMLTRLLDDGDGLDVLGTPATVLAVPGHTLGHIAYHLPEARRLFCGDTLFSGGCGRLFEGTPAQMLDSLTRLAALPGDTAVYCTHEYTQSNLAFADAVEPGNADLATYRAQVAQWRRQQRPSLPSSIGLERRINPFLRWREPAVRSNAARHAGQALTDDVAVFAAVRAWKDGFRPPPAA